MKSLIYPSNFSPRDYQIDITKNAIDSNSLVSLPTGLGKTLIAATIILNYLDWFPNFKLIFMAPTRPLVIQQLKACYEISNVNLKNTSIMIDQSPSKRSNLWESNKLFFTTPHIVLNDLKNGNLDPKTVKLLIFDEAHRAMGQYPYTKIVSFLNDLKLQVNFRVLALTATPGTNLESIQSIIDNLNISQTLIRLDTSEDVKQYIKSKEIVEIDCPPLPTFEPILNMISKVIKPTLDELYNSNLYPHNDPTRINHFVALQKSTALIKESNSNAKWTQFNKLKLLSIVGLLIQRLQIYGVLAFNNLFIEKYNDFKNKVESKKSNNKLMKSFWLNDSIAKDLNSYLEKLIKENHNSNHGSWCHSKFRYLIKELKNFNLNIDNSKCIIFVEYRDVALDIIKAIESINDPNLKSHIFIGQSPEKKRKTATPSSSSSSSSNLRINSSISAHQHGLKQSSQNKVLKDFKSGKYNILVATSIGEEGLDIGEVDLIINFDSNSSVIKNLQRIGRTGRKRDGKVVLLFSLNEQQKYQSSQYHYKCIQNELLKNDQLDYFNQTPFLDYEPELEFKKIVNSNKESVETVISKFLKDSKESKAKRAKKDKKMELGVDWIKEKGGFNKSTLVNTEEDDDEMEFAKNRPAVRSSKIDFNKFNDDDDDLLNTLFGSSDNTKESNIKSNLKDDEQACLTYSEVSDNVPLALVPLEDESDSFIFSDDDIDDESKLIDDEPRIANDAAAVATSSALGSSLRFDEDIFSDDEDNERLLKLL